MAPRCFFVEHVDPNEEFLRLTKDAAYHAEAVLRLREGDSVEIRDGIGGAWEGSITRIKGRELHVKLGAECYPGNESHLKITLALAFSRMDRMELVLRQVTEIGVYRFVSFRAQRSQYDLSGSQLSKRRERWSRIAREALCQCGRVRLPEIVFIPGVHDLIAMASSWENEHSPTLKILAYEDEKTQSLFSLWRFSPIYRQVIGIVGPEGGWDQGEVDLLLDAGFHPVHLGPRTLRLETAATALAASVQLLWGDLGE